MLGNNEEFEKSLERELEENLLEMEKSNDEIIRLVSMVKKAKDEAKNAHDLLKELVEIEKDGGLKSQNYDKFCGKFLGKSASIQE